MKSSLAIHGGSPGVTIPLPPRKQFGPEELEMVREVFSRSWETGKDFGYQGEFESRYTDAFVEMQGGGFADAVCSGTAALFLCLAALELPEGAEVVFPPVTDPGGITPFSFLGLRCRIADSQPGSHHMGVEQLEAALTEQSKAVVLVHLAGIPLELDPILTLAERRGLKVVEDCSQAHGAKYRGSPLGTFGHLAFFSTMFSKNHSSGGCGGIVYSKDRSLFEKTLLLADRGKAVWDREFHPKRPSGYLCPGMNFHQNELSSAIGISTLKKLPEVIKRRTEILNSLAGCLQGSRSMRVRLPAPHAEASPFFAQVSLRVECLSVTKKEFTDAIAAEGVPINPDYDFVVTEWPWFKQFLAKGTATPNAASFRERSFNILFHEKFSEELVGEIGQALLKVDKALATEEV